MLTRAYVFIFMICSRTNAMSVLSKFSIEIGAVIYIYVILLFIATSVVSPGMSKISNSGVHSW